jgi:hypothetical protein
MRTGKLVALEDVFNIDIVLKTLRDGGFIQIYDIAGDEHSPTHLEMGYRDSRVLHYDENHNYDFYFDNDSLYLIINAITARYYTIYRATLQPSTY